MTGFRRGWYDGGKDRGGGRMELSDREYLERLFEAFYEVGALPGGGVTRLGYTALEDEMHRRFGALAEALGGTVETDLAGNSYAFLAPAEEYVLIGSHLDSVIQGGGTTAWPGSWRGSCC